MGQRAVADNAQAGKAMLAVDRDGASPLNNNVLPVITGVTDGRVRRENGAAGHAQGRQQAQQSRQDEQPGVFTVVESSDNGCLHVPAFVSLRLDSGTPLLSKNRNGIMKPFGSLMSDKARTQFPL
jgi:hypothetical protein